MILFIIVATDLMSAFSVTILWVAASFSLEKNKSGFQICFSTSECTVSFSSSSLQLDSEQLCLRIAGKCRHFNPGAARSSLFFSHWKNFKINSWSSDKVRKIMNLGEKSWFHKVRFELNRFLSVAWRLSPGLQPRVNKGNNESALFDLIWLIQEQSNSIIAILPQYFYSLNHMMYYIDI